jgi:hypothetical protein
MAGVSCGKRAARPARICLQPDAGVAGGDALPDTEMMRRVQLRAATPPSRAAAAPPRQNPGFSQKPGFWPRYWADYA